MKRDTILGIDATGEGLHVALSKGGRIIRTFTSSGLDSLRNDLPRDLKGAYFTGEFKELFIRRLKVPYMPNEELNNALRWELKSGGIPFDISRAVVDYQVIGESIHQDGTRNLDIMAAALGADESDGPAAQLKSLGLELLGISPLSFAVWESIRESLNTKETLCIAHIGRFDTNILICTKEKLQLIRVLTLGESAFVEALTGKVVSDKGTIELSQSQADELLRKEGIPKGAQLLSLLRPALEKLANEIRRSIDYFKNELGGEGVERVVLSGSGSQTKGLVEYLSADLALPVSSSDAGPFAAACGLTKGGMNLLSDVHRHARRRTLERISLRMLAVGFLGLMALSYIGLKLSIAGLENQLEAEAAHWNNLQPIYFLCESVQTRMRLIELILQNQVPMSEAMKSLSNIISANIQLDEFTYTKSKNELRMRGQAFQGKRTSEENLAQFLSAIEKSLLFEGAALIKVDRSDSEPSSARFEITCSITR